MYVSPKDHALRNLRKAEILVKEAQNILGKTSRDDGENDFVFKLGGEINRNIQKAINIMIRGKQITKKHSHVCESSNPDHMCSDCDCWKKTRQLCS